MHILNNALKLLYALPLTVALLVFIIGVGTWTRIYKGTLSPRWIRKFGFSPKDLWSIRLERLFLSLFFTNNRKSFIQAVIMIFIAVGETERVGGTLRAALTFWGIHITTLVILSLFIIFPLHKLKISWGQELALVKDVGPSAGYFGCLGFITHSLPSPWPWLIGFLIFSGIFISFLMPPGQGESVPVKRHADWAHMIAFALGILSGIVWPIPTLFRSYFL